MRGKEITGKWRLSETEREEREMKKESFITVRVLPLD